MEIIYSKSFIGGAKLQTMYVCMYLEFLKSIIVCN